jgi:glyoxylase-like metal-dependent hydrolase (beta-lactamase superfamily II)
MIIGDYRLDAIETGSFALDGGAMFGVVPRPLWGKTNPPDERNRIAMAARALLIRGGGRTILVDTGNGTKYSDKLRDIYAIESGKHDIATSLRAHGVSPADVTDVILTHLHFDHAGGATVRAGDRVVAAFPNAVYYVQESHWDAAHNPTERDRASFFPDDYDPLRRDGQLRFLSGPEEIFPGIRLRIFHGHTTALQAPFITDGKKALLYCADLIPMTPHVALPWIMAYDLRPLVTLEEKRLILRSAVDFNWILFFEHDPRTAAATVRLTEKGYEVADRMDDAFGHAPSAGS